jgi:hypothetical protein
MPISFVYPFYPGQPLKKICEYSVILNFISVSKLTTYSFTHELILRFVTTSRSDTLV